MKKRYHSTKGLSSSAPTNRFNQQHIRQDNKKNSMYFPPIDWIGMWKIASTLFLLEWIFTDSDIFAQKITKKEIASMSIKISRENEFYFMFWLYLRTLLFYSKAIELCVYVYSCVHLFFALCIIYLIRLICATFFCHNIFMLFDLCSFQVHNSVMPFTMFV